MTSRRWLAPTGLILLSAVPVLAGAFRITQLSTGATVTPDNARFFADPVPVVVHIVTVTVFCVGGAFQFLAHARGSGAGRRPGVASRSGVASRPGLAPGVAPRPRPGLALRRPAWHRVNGRVLVPAGLGAALSGLWLTVFYPRPDDVGDLVTVFRLVFGTAMAASIVIGLVAVRRRDFVRHQTWMVRGYAIGIGAGTQAFTHVAVMATGSPITTTSKAYAMLAGWLINLAVAEYVIRRPSFVSPGKVATR
jgi:hypothetical protein